MKTIKIIVTGKVQGVFFRKSTKEKADLLGVKGIVRNLVDGKTVEIIATANQDKISEFIKWCEHGPKNAVVNNIKLSDLPLTYFDHFSIV